MGGMKQILLPALIALSLTSPVKAESQMDEGLSLIDRGARLFFRGLLDEMEPALKDLDEMSGEMAAAIDALMSEMGPALVELYEKIDDFKNYEAPEVLPNGDIIIRRKDEAPVYELPEGEIEL